MPPPGFLHSPVASSPQGRPYMWSPLVFAIVAVCHNLYNK